ncbi:MAG: phosphoribosylglycinamide formyltransferase, partial [Proteobacteria bacterium]|nr:phosphoribosylglycinamide formyltransferase [Pseudomonadota bacterium]
MASKIKVGTLISGGGTNLQAIIDACLDHRIDAQIVFTGSDTPGVKGLERAQKANIETFVVDYSQIIQSCKKKEIADSDLPEDFNLEEMLSKQKLMDQTASLDQLAFFLKS